MKVITSGQVLSDDSSIFLAGPTPRSSDVPSWRPEAIELLKRMKFTGAVFAPEPFCSHYLEQVEWEHAALTKASVILFWVPRDLVTMPAFTTNVEFGRFADSGRIVVYGRPEGAPKTRYLDWLHHKHNPAEPIFDNLPELLEYAIKCCG